MSRVKQSYNSYGGLSKKQFIIEILQREQRPLTPKEICWISKSDSRFETLNHSTVKVYCRQLLMSNKIYQPIHGYYEVTENRYGVLRAAEIKVHDLRLVWDVGIKESLGECHEVVGGVKVDCQFGSVRGKVSAVVACDEGMDFHTVCFAVDLIRRMGWEKAGVNLDVHECKVCCEFNEDFKHVRLDGVKCATVKSFLGNLERVYDKQGCVRSEIKVEETSLESMYTMLKGGVSSYNILQSQFMLMKKLDRIAFLLESNLKNEGR